MLRSYNKIRKPLDLYVEQGVAMASELVEVRSRRVPWLRLPLDSPMFPLSDLFSDGGWNDRQRRSGGNLFEMNLD